MYIIRALKAHTDEFVDIGTFRSNVIAKETLIKLADEMQEDLAEGDTIKIHMGVYQFSHHPKQGSPIIYYITTD